MSVTVPLSMILVVGINQGASGMVRVIINDGLLDSSLLNQKFSTSEIGQNQKVGVF